MAKKCCPNHIFGVNFQVSFSFYGDMCNYDTNYACYFSLSNVTQGFETVGNNFNQFYPYLFTPGWTAGIGNNVSGSYVDSFNLKSWNDQDNYCVLMYMMDSNVDPNSFSNGSFSVFIQPIIQYGG